MPPKSLSHGTLGLKFMNRSSSTIVAPPPGPSVSKTAQPKRVVQAEDDPEWVLPGFAVTPAQQQAAASVEVEGSYLPFLLGGREKAEKEAAWREKSGKGGRRSFGGLNKDVEKLSLPPAPPASAAPTTAETSSASDPSASAPIASSSTTRAAPPSKSQTSSNSRPPRKAPSLADGTILLNQPSVGDRPQPTASSSTSSSGFLRPQGFDDAAPSSSSAKKTKKRKSGEGEAAAGGGLLRLGELGLAELAGVDGGDDADADGAKEKKHGRKNKDRKRARKEAEMRGGG